MKLELEHLAPYLPYGLIISIDPVMNSKIRMTSGDIVYVLKYQCKPMLRPMDDIKQIYYLEKLLDYILPNSEDHNLSLSKIESKIRHKTWFIQAPSKYDDSYTPIKIYKRYSPEMKLSHYEFLIKNNFDVFNLIPAGLAIDINTI